MGGVQLDDPLEIGEGGLGVALREQDFRQLEPGGNEVLVDLERVPDRTAEGLVLRDVPGRTVQYHPEASPGPQDSHHLFKSFVDMMRSTRAVRDR